MKKLMYLILIFVAVSMVVGAPFAGASKEADESSIAPSPEQDPVPEDDWSDEPGAMPPLLDGKKPDRPLIFVEPASEMDGIDAAEETAINVWYGNTQNFGQKGNPQQWVNILGDVTADLGVKSLTYSLNGGPNRTLTVGPGKPNNPRLVSMGDFNIEIDHTTLNPNPQVNKVVIRLTDTGDVVTTKEVTINYTPNKTWPQNYEAKWGSGAGIQDLAQVVDGEWRIVGGKLVMTGAGNIGYDRLIAIGDIGEAASNTWTDYEVTVPLTVKAIDPLGYGPPSNGPGVGIIQRWQGHTQNESEQPRLEWRERIGALGWYRWDKNGTEGLVIQGGGWGSTANTEKVLQFNTPYILKMSVQSSTSEAFYRLKMWRQGNPEPYAWDTTTYCKKNCSPSGSAMLVAHHVDVEFGNVEIRRLDDLSFTLTTGTTGTGNISVNPAKIIFSYGENARLTAFPGQDFYLESWSGDLSVPGTTNPLNVIMTQDMNITANFKKGVPGKLTVNIQGQGDVTKSPDKDLYAGGELVQLTAVPKSGFMFKEWTGDIKDDANPVTIRIDGDKTVKATFVSAGEASPISDDFNRCELSMPPWSLVDPAGKGSQQVANGIVKIAAQAGPTITMWNTNRNAPRIMQTTEDQDFTVIMKFNSIPTGKNQIQGFLAEQDGQNWVRFDFYGTSDGKVKMFAGATTGGVSKGKGTESVPVSGATTIYMRVKRIGNQWSQAFSYDGMNWQSEQTFAHTLTVNKSGLFAGNENAATSPTFTLAADYFHNVAFPAGITGFLLATEVEGAGEVRLDPQPAENGRYYCGQDVTLEAVPRDTFKGWTGSLSGSKNPTSIRMNGDKAVKAHFDSEPGPGGDFMSYMPSIVRP